MTSKIRVEEIVDLIDFLCICGFPEEFETMGRLIVDKLSYVSDFSMDNGKAKEWSGAILYLIPELSLAAFLGLCSGAMNKPVQSQLAVLGSFSIGGTINKIEELANVLQVCFDAGAKKVLLPMSSAADLTTVPPELFAKFQTSFYTSPEDAVFKALGVD